MPNKQKISLEEKLRIIWEYLDGNVGLRECSRMAGVSSYTLEEWIRNYKNDGIEAFLSHKNHVYDPNLKRAAVEDYQNGGGSLSDICQKYHIRSHCSLRAWIKVYNSHGDLNSVKHSGGGGYMTQRRDTTQEERIQIVKDCLESDQNYGAIAQKYNVSYQQVRTWTLRFKEMGEAGLEDRRGRRKKDQEPRTELEQLQIENEKLKHQLYLAEMERDLLKKLNDLEGGEAYRK